MPKWGTIATMSSCFQKKPTTSDNPSTRLHISKTFEKFNTLVDNNITKNTFDNVANHLFKFCTTKLSMA
jgi:hypothetical protein